jgi:soluble lytic murein transglycosylase-like protein
MVPTPREVRLSCRALKAVLFALLTALPGALQAGEAVDSPWTLCRDAIAEAEQARDLPAHLLAAIARTESGRWHKERSESLAWPWTVMAEGEGRFLPSKAAAIETVRALQARGVRNIDVGCMQVNLYYHPDAFENLEAAFDPAANVAYAADFLTGLRAEARSWTRAVGQYHTREAIRGNGYRAKVFKAWREERHRANRERQAALRAARAAGWDSDS